MNKIQLTQQQNNSTNGFNNHRAKSQATKQNQSIIYQSRKIFGELFTIATIFLPYPKETEGILCQFSSQAATCP